MNLGWIRNLFTLSEIERGRIREPASDPRRIESFQDIESMVMVSLIPPAPVTIQTTTHRILSESNTPKTTERTVSRSLLDQDLLKKLLKHRPQYTSSRILRAETAAATAAATPTNVTTPEGTS